MNKFIYSILIYVILFGCKQANTTTNAKHPLELPVSFMQNGKQIEPSSGVITLKKMPFDIVFKETIPFDIMVNASFNERLYNTSAKPDVLTLQPEFKINATIAETLFNEDEAVYISNDATNVWYYEDEQHHKFNEVNINNGTYESIRTIKKFNDINTDLIITNSQMSKPVYLVFLSVKRYGSVNELTEVKRLGIKIEWEKPSREESKTHFSNYISKIDVKHTPLQENTSFDSFIDPDDYDDVDAAILSLDTLYPNFYTEGYNYKAIAHYKLQLSDQFHTLVVTVLKGEYEMETQLINYDLNGNIIDAIVVSYDEIAEGAHSSSSKIKNLTIKKTSITWMDEKEERMEYFQINNDGSCSTVSNLAKRKE